MTEKQSRRASLLDPFQAIRNKTPGGKHASHTMDNKLDNAREIHKKSRVFSLGSFNPIKKGSSKLASFMGKARSTRHEALESQHQTSAPLLSKTFTFDPAKSTEKVASTENRHKKIKISFRRLASRISPFSSPTSSQTSSRSTSLSGSTLTESSKNGYSRIPAPIKAPKGGLYSHEVFKKEKKRDVLSSSNRHYMSIKRSMSGSGNNSMLRLGNQMEQTRHSVEQTKARQFKIHGVRTVQTHEPVQPVRVLQPRQQSHRAQYVHLPSDIEPVQPLHSVQHIQPVQSAAETDSACEKDLLRGSKVNEAIKSCSQVNAELSPKRFQSLIPRKAPSPAPASRPFVIRPNNTRSSIPVSVKNRAATRTSALASHDQSQTPGEKNAIKTKNSKRSPVPNKDINLKINKVRSSGPLPVKEEAASIEHQDSDCRPITALKMTNSELLERNRNQPGKLRFSKGFSDLRVLQREGTDAKFLKDNKQEHSISVSSPHIEHTKNMQTTRQKDRTQRMVPPGDEPSRIPRTTQKKLITTISSAIQVSEAQPQQYWLGRFMTLTNAFHYEDSFNEPDIATGFGMLSSYSRPLSQHDVDTPNYRVKRAFMVLENVCMTEEASASLREFRDQYIAIHGDKWML